MICPDLVFSPAAVLSQTELQASPRMKFIKHSIILKESCEIFLQSVTREAATGFKFHLQRASK